MASATNSKTLSIGASTSDTSKYTLQATFNETSSSVANNTSTISVTAKISNKSYSFSGTSCTLDIYWYDDNAYKGGKKVATTSFSSMSANTNKTATGSVTVTHNSDGNLKGYAKAVFTRSSSNSYCPATNNVSTANTSLTYLPRIEFTPSVKTYDSISNTLTGGTTKVINNVSQIQGVITTSDTVTNAYYIYNGVTNTSTAKTYNFSGRFTKENNSYGFRVANSTGTSATKYVTVADSNIINYTLPTITNAALKRTDGTGTTVRLTATVNLWYGSFGSQTNNSCTITYKYKQGSASTYTTTTETKSFSSATLSLTKDFTGIATENDLEVQVFITDKTGVASSIFIFTCPKAVSVFDIGEDFINVNVDLYEKGVKIHSGNDTGWVDIPLASGVSVGTLGGTPQYRKIGNHVFIRGGYKGSKASAALQLGTLPEGYRPISQVYDFNATAGNRVARTYVQPGGGVMLEWIWTLQTNPAVYTGAFDWVNVEMDFWVD